MMPTEEQEQRAFAEWLEVKRYPHYHAPSETGSSMEAKRRAIKMKRLGTTKGFPDLIVMIPVRDFDDNIGAYEAVFVEMKRKKGGVVSKEQKEWLSMLEMAGFRTVVAKGCEEAIAYIEGVEKCIN